MHTHPLVQSIPGVKEETNTGLFFKNINRGPNLARQNKLNLELQEHHHNIILYMTNIIRKISEFSKQTMFIYQFSKNYKILLD